MHFDYTIPIIWLIALALQSIGVIVGVMRAYGKFELLLNTLKEGDIRELRNSVDVLKSGQDEWTKALRERTHELTNIVNTLVLKVDRLERPYRYPQPEEPAKPS